MRAKTIRKTALPAINDIVCGFVDHVLLSINTAVVLHCLLPDFDLAVSQECSSYLAVIASVAHTTGSFAAETEGTSRPSHPQI